MTLGVIGLLFGLVGVMALAAGLYTPDKPRAQLEADYATPPSKFVWAGGMRLHVRETGPAAGPAVIMLHGFGSSLFTWEAWSAGLSDAYRVIRFDLPGFGLTGPDPTGDYSDARGLQVLTALMEVLSVETAALIGNSLGGKWAWMFAAENPRCVSKLILVAPDGFATSLFRYGQKNKAPLVARLLPYALPNFLVRRILAAAFGDPAALTNAMIERYRDMMRAPGNRGATLARMEQIDVERPDALLAAIKAPTLLVWGDKDMLIPIGNLSHYLALIPGGRSVVFPDLGHLPQEEAPVQSLAPVRAFLDRSI
ncbi:pimeloyl-ACP methyl ester carboxylesterase [Rhodoblastus sphagnicola]|nr:alpha/beta hydrolase [Rhodoblastus sphagnicola]MBB4198238.1 pimeloyl-ACP methyl ester carboxylesterase [Rhodoblastus sphagnicola]